MGYISYARRSTGFRTNLRKKRRKAKIGRKRKYC